MTATPTTSASSTDTPQDRAWPIPLSVLDLATVSKGATTADALADTTALAARADELGFHRFWVAEHHNMASVASTSPAVLAAHLAAATTTIKVGSGGVMLPNHAPLVVAEQFALLEALHPGRIDLGIGRAPGTDQATATALRRRSDHQDEEQFPRNVIDVLGLLGDPRTEHGLWDRFRATPAASSMPSVLLLGSSGFSAQLAGVLGLRFTFAHHFDTGGTMQAVEVYRDYFEPSEELAEPYVVVTASVLAAPDGDEAERLAAPGRLSRYRLRTGRLLPPLAPEEAAADPDFPAAMAMAAESGSIVGDPRQCVAGMCDLVERTGADELMLHTMTHGLRERVRSLELVAEAWADSPTI